MAEDLREQWASPMKRTASEALTFPGTLAIDDVIHVHRVAARRRANRADALWRYGGRHHPDGQRNSHASLCVFSGIYSLDSLTVSAYSHGSGNT